ncbi:uncharacterized protein [Populus alba]|uniref:uncharacterized protein isoform X4 n=1 Tax=Populus alba TaxID=43335 RepID=UPI003CC77D7B
MFGVPLTSFTGSRKPNETMRILLTTFLGVVFGFLIGVSFPTLSLTKSNKSSGFFPVIDLAYSEDKPGSKTVLSPWSSMKGNNSSSMQAPNSKDKSKIWVPSNPRGAERLPPGFVVAESDYYLRRLWGDPKEDLTSAPRYLVTFTVGYDQRKNIDACVKKFSENFTILLFHYDGRVSEWDEFEWSKSAIHVSARKQTKWWYAKRFLHPDIVAPYDYIFIWDEDLGVEHFNAEEITDEKPGWCTDPHLPPCAAFVEIMAPVFSRDAWRCVWHMIQNDLVHGWGLDFALRKCIEPAHEKIGVVDSQWIVHQTIPSLGNQGESQNGKKPWQGVKERCRKEWTMFQNRLASAERTYFRTAGLDPPNSNGH